MIIHDAHVHVGQFRDLYSRPKEVFEFLCKTGVYRMAVSSTGSCSLNPDVPIGEVREIVSIGGPRIVPVLWINPEWMRDGSIEKLLNCGIEWRCIKVHGYFSRWEDCPELLQRTIELAKKMNLPFLFHTGGRPESDAGSYRDIIGRNLDTRFILAHSRPVEQTIKVLETCPNAWADTAFTPVEDVAAMIKCGFANRIIWGTDYPLHNVFYEGEDIAQHLANRIADFRRVMSVGEWELVSHLNFESIWGDSMCAQSDHPFKI